MENKPVVTVSVQQTRADFFDLWKASRFKYLTWILLLIGVFYLYWAFAVFMNDGYTSETSFTILQFSFVALFAFFGAFIVPRFRAQITLQGPVAREQRNISVSPQGVSVASPVFTATYNWTAFTLIKETKRSFLLFTAPIIALIIPKRAFSSPDELQQVRSLIVEYFPGRTTLRG
jgi:YcxB-like protein